MIISPEERPGMLLAGMQHGTVRLLLDSRVDGVEGIPPLVRGDAGGEA